MTRIHRGIDVISRQQATAAHSGHGHVGCELTLHGALLMNLQRALVLLRAVAALPTLHALLLGDVESFVVHLQKICKASPTRMSRAHRTAPVEFGDSRSALPRSAKAPALEAADIGSSGQAAGSVRSVASNVHLGARASLDIGDSNVFPISGQVASSTNAVAKSDLGPALAEARAGLPRKSTSVRKGGAPSGPGRRIARVPGPSTSRGPLSARKE
jgi:hypothetical protein